MKLVTSYCAAPLLSIHNAIFFSRSGSLHVTTNQKKKGSTSRESPFLNSKHFWVATTTKTSPTATRLILLTWLPNGLYYANAANHGAPFLDPSSSLLIRKCGLVKMQSGAIIMSCDNGAEGAAQVAGLRDPSFNFSPGTRAMLRQGGMNNGYPVLSKFPTSAVQK